MLHEFSRTELLIGKEGVELLSRSHVAVFGIGGVGSYTVEALARSGIGTLSLFDSDTVTLTNLNRQLIATHETIGIPKVQAAKERILTINPDARVFAWDTFYDASCAGRFPLSQYDYVVDAIDTVSSKLLLAEQAAALHVPILSCMGAGNKLDPTKFEVTDIYRTSMCPLARVMRSELRKRGIPKLKVVYSTEPAITPRQSAEDTCPPGSSRRQTPGSVAFVPSVAGLIAAAEVVKDLLSRSTAV